MELAAANALTAIQNCLSDGKRIPAELQMTVYLNPEDGFLTHPQVADHASEYLIKQLGPDSIGSRAAVGIATLP